MAKIIPLADYKARSALQDGYCYWRTLFDEALNAETRLTDLSPKTLYCLADPCDESTTSLYALIIGFSGHGRSASFESLASSIQSSILDVYLFLSDQIRFEIMFRLGWLECFSGNQYTIFEMVTSYERVKTICMAQPPSLAKTHPDFEEYVTLFERDQQVFIRRMLTSALQAFKQVHRLG